MDKKVVIAIVLSMVVLFTYPYIVNRFYPAQPPKKAAQAPLQAGKQTAPGEAGKAANALSGAALKEELIPVETPVIKAVFTSNGGGVKSLELKKFSEELGKPAPVVNLAKSILTNGSFRTQVFSNGVIENIEFQPSKTKIALQDNESGELILTGTTKGGLRVDRKYLFTGASYIIKTEINVTNAASTPFNGRIDTVFNADVSGKDKTGYHSGPIILTKDKLMRQTEKEAQLTGSAGLKWVGLENKYFISAIIPGSDLPVNWVTGVPEANSSKAELQVPLALGPGERAAYSYSIFSGPKEYDLLLKQKTGLEEAIEFGYFGFMAKPLLVVLNFFERYLGNYGISIIIITVILKVIFYPLTKHSLNSMKEMQKIQPQLAVIKEKYKDNKEKLNKEMMDLYKRYKINPLGGCLPMVLQIPVFIALYEVLYVAIELRHAPLFLWIKDLSDKDPYYITPLVMGVTMFIQQKMSPSTPDPAQAKIMLIMPVVFTFMFLNFPAGLVLYWLVNNVLSIAQQYYIQKAPSKA